MRLLIVPVIEAGRMRIAAAATAVAPIASPFQNRWKSNLRADALPRCRRPWQRRTGLDWTGEEIAKRIRNGKAGQMTAFAGKLQPAQIELLVAYLRSLK